MLTKFVCLCALLTAALMPTDAGAATVYRLGFFHAGESLYHSDLRREFTSQLELLAPDSVTIEADPRAYGDGRWNRDTTRLEAERLARIPDVDLMITMGPWVVEDLLEAGYKGPIVSMHRVDPDLEGLLDESGRPVADNLTVHVKPNKLFEDLQLLSRLTDLKRLGVLYFPTGDETAKLIERIEEIGRQLGFEVRYGEGYDNAGTFAFFKAYNNLDRGFLDAVYVMPVWGMTPVKVTSFFQRLTGDRLLTLAYEGRTAVNRGAALGNGGASLALEARYNATKAWRILQGATPADLSVSFPSATGVAINQANAEQAQLEIPIDLLSEAVVVNPSQPRDSEQYSLRLAIRRALDQHPDHLAMYDAIRAARAAVVETRAAYLPQVEAEYRLRHYGDNAVTNSRDRLDATGQRLSLQLEQALLSLETLRAADVDRRRIQLSEAQRIDIQHALELAVIQAYLTVAEAELRMALERDMNLEVNLRFEAARATWMIDSTGMVDWLRWADALQVAAYRVAAARRDRAVAQAALNALLNRPGELPMIIDTAGLTKRAFEHTFESMQVLLDNPDKHNKWIGQLVSEALASHPEMMRSRAQVSVDQSRLSVNSARWLPTIGFRAQFNAGRELQDAPPEFEEKTTWWWLGGTIRVPLFEGGRKWRERNRLQAELSVSEYRRDAASLQVMQQIHRRWHDLVLALEAAYRGVRSDEAAARTWQTILDPYLSDLSRVTTTDLMATLERRRLAGLDMLGRRYEFYRAAAELVYAVGWSLHDRHQEPVAALQDILAR